MSHSIIVQFPIDGMGTEEDLERSHRIEDLLDSKLIGEPGLGYCNGGDIGGGTMNIFVYDVEDKQKALNAIVDTLKTNNLLVEGLNISASENDEPYFLIWPEGASGDFMLFGAEHET